MPTFEMKHPDGRTFEVDAPDMKAAEAAIGEIPHGQPIGLLANAVAPITNLPSTYKKAVHESVDQMKRGVEQVASGEPWEIAKGAGNVAMGGLGYVGAPVSAAVDSIVGQPVENITGIPAPLTDFATTLALPIPKSVPRMPRTAAPAVTPTRMMDVTLSEGQATRELPAIQREQAALRGGSGPPAQKVAQAFTDQQKAELEAARGSVAGRLDEFGQRIVESPQEAGELVSETMKKTAASRKAGVEQAYKTARDLPGEIHADAFTGISQKIKTDLSGRPEPVIIDDKLTPFASQMIRDIDERVSQLKIQNRAQPASTSMMPAGETAEIVGVDLKGVEQMRKRLSTFRKDAYGSGNAADGRAAKAVIDAFDAQMDAAVNGGMFRGDPRAINAWNDARAAHADYRRTFGTSGSGDPIGRVVEKILGRANNPAAIPNDVADFMYGTAGTNPTSLNVGVANRLKTILGDKSPEWSAVKQGLFSRLVESGEGMKEMGPTKVAERLNRFLNVDGREMSQLLFSKAERSMLQRYGDLMRQIEVPQAGANWSNTAAFAGQGYKPSLSARALESIGSKVGVAVGAVIGHFVVPGLPFGAAEAAGAATSKIAGMSGQAMEARKIAKQMPIIGNVVRDYRDAATATETSPTARNVARLTLAARNLATNLKDMGITVSPNELLRSVQGPVPASAEHEQQ